MRKLIIAGLLLFAPLHPRSQDTAEDFRAEFCRVLHAGTLGNTDMQRRLLDQYPDCANYPPWNRLKRKAAKPTPTASAGKRLPSETQSGPSWSELFAKGMALQRKVCDRLGEDSQLCTEATEATRRVATDYYDACRLDYSAEFCMDLISEERSANSERLRAEPTAKLSAD